jgi:hypothetical protein
MTDANPLFDIAEVKQYNRPSCLCLDSVKGFKLHNTVPPNNNLTQVLLWFVLSLFQHNIQKGVVPSKRSNDSSVSIEWYSKAFVLYSASSNSEHEHEHEHEYEYKKMSRQPVMMIQ